MVERIQILRGMSVLGIFLYHFNEDVFQHGFLGVDVFFMISGYVIYPKLREVFDGSINVNSGIVRFYEKRIWRLLPAFIAAMLISSILLFITAPLEDHKRIWRAATFSLIGLGNFGAYKYSGDYFNPNPNPFVHHWSLAVEEQIYIFLPAFLFLGYLVSANLLNKILYGLIFASAFLAISGTVTNSMLEKLGVKYAELLNLQFYLPTHRFWQFGIGAVCALYVGRIRIHDFLWRFLFFALALLILTPIDFLNSTIQTTLILSITLILLINQQKELPESGVIYGFLRSVGDCSYSVYLIHMPIIYIIKYSPLISANINEIESFLLYAFFTSLLTIRVLFPIEKKFRIKGP